MSTRERAATVAMTLFTATCLALTGALMFHAAASLPWWCAWAPPAAWAVGLAAIGRLVWQEWREVWRP
jgi:hypothetical protein